jgi:hypothetical protein
MIVIRAELWPYGEPPRKHLGTAVIGNDGTGSIRTGNYDIWLGNQDEQDPWRIILNREDQVLNQLRVEGFPRQELDHWHLLGRALSELEK